MKAKPIHLNIPQLTNQLVKATKSYHVWARGTGKTTGVLSLFYLENARTMPRGQHGIVGATFQQLLVRTLPPIIQMWNRLGYKEGQHFVVGREPSEKFKRMWKWQPPRTKPLDSKYAIYWFNGAVNVLISQDRAGSSNGLSLVSLGGDEAKLLNKERLDDETIPALRGDRSHFGHLSSYRSECYTTDMPTTPASSWILDKASEMDETQIELIIQFQLKVNLLRKELLTCSQEKRPGIIRKIKSFESKLHQLRIPRKVGNEYKYSIFYSEASALDNMDVLGPEYLSDMKRILSTSKYETSILNKRKLQIENGFYGNLVPEKHGTEWFNNGYLDSFIGDLANRNLTNADSRQDSGFNPNEPLDIAFDYGDKINTIVVGQWVGNEYRILNNLYVLHPELVDAVVQKFCDYYKHYRAKTVTYIFDHTALPSSGVTDFNYYLRVIETLKRNGWTIIERYIGNAPRHETKYEFVNLLLQESDPNLPRIRYSRTRCKYMETSMLNAGIKPSDRGFKKDKSTERDPNVPAEESTHISDAFDTLVFGKLHQISTDNSQFIPMV